MAIAGLGGVGKTQLALEYSYRHEDDYASVWWFRAETLDTLGGDMMELATTMELVDQNADQTTAIAALLGWMGEQENTWLFVYDNTPGPGELRDYIPKRSVHHSRKEC